MKLLFFFPLFPTLKVLITDQSPHRDQVFRGKKKGRTILRVSEKLLFKKENLEAVRKKEIIYDF